MRIGTSRPYPATGLTTALWRDVPLEFVRLENLVTTQDGVSIQGLLDRSSPAHPGDRFPHVVEHHGVLYLEDGHNRVCRLLLSGNTVTACRVLRR